MKYSIKKLKQIKSMIFSNDSDMWHLGYKYLFKWNELNEKQRDFIEHVMLNPLFPEYILLSDQGLFLQEEIDCLLYKAIHKKGDIVSYGGVQARILEIFDDQAIIQYNENGESTQRQVDIESLE